MAILSDFSPISASVEIHAPVDAVWPVLFKEFGGKPKLSWLSGKPRGVRIKGWGVNEKIDLIDQGETTFVRHVIHPKQRWGDGAFGYTWLPKMNQKLEELKRSVEGT